MQENRAFVSISDVSGLLISRLSLLINHTPRLQDHYFGSLAGVRGFKDPNVQVNPDGRSAFYQQVNASLSNTTDYLLPFHIPYQGEPGRKEATQCSYAGSNGWEKNQAALAAGANDQWALGNSPHSVGYWKRDDIPIHYAIA
ncbi:hypothetical protein RQP46_011189 [Phenoliferia psychrophenolica]